MPDVSLLPDAPPVIGVYANRAQVKRWVKIITRQKAVYVHPTRSRARL
jgi:hypothetical protein